MTPTINRIARYLRSKGFSFHHRAYQPPIPHIAARYAREGKKPPIGVVWYRPQWLVPSPIGGKRLTLQVDTLDPLDDDNKLREVRDSLISAIMELGYDAVKAGKEYVSGEGVIIEGVQ